MQNLTWGRCMRSQFIKARVGALGVVVTGLLLALAMPFSAFAASNTVYNATPAVLPPNVQSLGYEATSTAQFGDYVHLAGTSRKLDTVTVTMSNWALYSDYVNDARYSANNVSWTHPITVNVYSNHLDANGVPDTLLATTTQSVSIPWRPAASPACGGTAWLADDNNCYNGKAFNAVFDMSSLNVTLPDDVIIGVAYNTANYGASPILQAGPYNSLNVGISANQNVSVGTDDSINEVFWDTMFPGYSGGFKLDANWPSSGTVLLKITASDGKPTTKDQCKNDGWKTFGAFRNQGDCVRFVATKE